jgi:hypothetical protein
MQVENVDLLNATLCYTRVAELVHLIVHQRVDIAKTFGGKQLARTFVLAQTALHDVIPMAITQRTDRSVRLLHVSEVSSSCVAVVDG